MIVDRGLDQGDSNYGDGGGIERQWKAMGTLQVSQMWLFAIAESIWSRVDGLGMRTKVG